MKELFETYDGLILPVGTGVATKLENDKDAVSDDELSVLDEHLQIGNFGGFPSITIPDGFIDGLPVGLNITGKNYDDVNVLNIAYAIESKMDYKGQIAKEVK
jgi:aspartyl-tRNA(Asn)/glutamyl-tRNA(Gln) amidotransferase subunit A